MNQLFYVTCSECGIPFEGPSALKCNWSFMLLGVAVTYSVALFVDETAAHKEATLQGWQCYSESIGGTKCPECR